MEAATVAVDHGFFRNAPGEDSIPVLVMRYRETRLRSPHVVPEEGSGRRVDGIAKLFVILRLQRNGRLVIRRDQEAALWSMVSEVARMRSDAVTISERSAVGDSHRNTSLNAR